MNLLDIIIIAVVFLLVVKGFYRGFFRETASLTGVILGIWLANRHQPWLTGFLRSYLPNTPLLPFISFALIFILVLIACNLIGVFLSLLSKKANLGWTDRSLGAGVALAKGMVVIYFVIIMLTFYLPESVPLIAKSKMARLITLSSQSVIRMISPNASSVWKRKLEQENDQHSGVIAEKGQDVAQPIEKR
jgi:membrane protein required for colicin V production